ICYATASTFLGPGLNRQPAAYINCYMGTNKVGEINFYLQERGLPLPANVQATNGVIVANFDLGRFGDVLNLLRHHEPLRLMLTPAGLALVETTATEEVGSQAA
ncbi:MAG TPA: hypothetical protein VFR08_02745, partial [Candidatus Angelobacter sp.]|nr:hypothetical protein [Candidatus Angelobacter sp.]